MAFEAQTAAKQHIHILFLPHSEHSLHYKCQPVNCFFPVRLIANTYIHIVGKILSCLMLNYMVHRATTMLQRIKGY
jgi:hypothetical protein